MEEVQETREEREARFAEDRRKRQENAEAACEAFFRVINGDSEMLRDCLRAEHPTLIGMLGQLLLNSIKARLSLKEGADARFPTPDDVTYADGRFGVIPLEDRERQKVCNGTARMENCGRYIAGIKEILETIRMAADKREKVQRLLACIFSDVADLAGSLRRERERSIGPVEMACRGYFPFI